MKPPRSLKIVDVRPGAGRPLVPGDVAICLCRCTRRQGDVLFSNPPGEPFTIRVGERNCCAGIEYGLLGMSVGGVRTVHVPWNLTYVERKSFPDLPKDAMLIYEIELVSLPEKWDPEMESRLARNPDKAANHDDDLRGQTRPSST